MYHSTERVLLVSNFLGTLLTGEYMSVDFSDGSGMNLLDIYEKKWIEKIGGLYSGVDVSEKLGQPRSTLKVLKTCG